MIEEIYLNNKKDYKINPYDTVKTVVLGDFDLDSNRIIMRSIPPVISNTNKPKKHTKSYNSLSNNKMVVELIKDCNTGASNSRTLIMKPKYPELVIKRLQYNLYDSKKNINKKRPTLYSYSEHRKNYYQNLQSPSDVEVKESSILFNLSNL